MPDTILREIESGELVRETLAEDAVSFTGEHEAMYFSNLRKNLKSDLAALVINTGQSLTTWRCCGEWVLRKALY